jgi:hypothetical protein
MPAARKPRRKTVRAKVADVLNEREVALNAGKDKGIAVGDIADVITLHDVVDPDTKEPLGEVRTLVVSLRVESVAERLSIARTFQQKGGGTIYDILASTTRSTIQTIRGPQQPTAASDIYVAIGATVDIRPADEDGGEAES